MSLKQLNNEEKEILHIVKKFLKKKPFVQIIELINFTDKCLKNNENYNRNSIEKIIKSLIKKNIILIGSNITRGDIFNTPLRGKIYQYIRNNPGININDVKNKFNIGSNQTIWHIRMLNDFEFIRIVKIRNQKALFDIDLDENKDMLLFYLRNEKVQEIINLLLARNDPLRPTIISESL
ncbi:MAG: hypothetical protein JW891_14430, partial [Candidatus Lokiarchaeota archaeon]|nr:hypothetical protein [Candidatus Lokiarchaeota archaeon]